MEKRQYIKPRISREELEKELLEVNERLWAANQKLLREEKARMELFSNLSHDLRSPLAALVSSVEYLRVNTDEADAEKMEVLHLMGRRLRTMQTLINDMFLLTKVESASLELHKETVDAGAFLEEFFYEREADSRYDNRELILSVPSSLRVLISIDPEQMIRVLDNLFTNALKYSEENAQITLAALIDGNFLRIEVADTGYGISEEDLPYIFERSFRASRSRTPGDNSSGLGLAIAKGIVEQHGGTIQCDSILGEGSHFYVYLPVVTEN
ncbi:MAG: HAMP domain-containing histidine kinase [Acetatifactor sp.]|nr:HAMP domain-containing histidine kinase [Acetatifactor sp.]